MLREKFADLAHRQWSGWMEYLFSKSTNNEDGTVTIPRWAVDRWRRQMITPYHGLSRSEQISDEKEADRFLALLNDDREFTYEAKLWHDNGRIHTIQANTLEVLKSKCTVAMSKESVTSIEVQRVQTVGYFKSALLDEDSLLK